MNQGFPSLPPARGARSSVGPTPNLNGSLASSPPRRGDTAVVPSEPLRRWMPLLLLSVLTHGLAAAIWKHTNLDTTKFSLVYMVGKTVVCWGAWAAFGRKPLVEKEALPFWRSSLLSGLLGGFAWIAYFIAFERGPLSIVLSATAAYGAIAALFAVMLLRERLGGIQSAGVALVIAGSTLMGHAEGQGSTTASSTGSGWILATLISVLFWGLSSVAVKYAFALPRADDLRMWLAQWAGSCVTMLPFAWYWPSSGSWDWSTGVAAIAVVLLYLIGDLSFCSASVRGPVSIVNSLGGLYPLPAIAYSAWLLGEVPDAAGWTMIGLSLFGVLLIGAGVDKSELALDPGVAPAPQPTVVRIEEVIRQSLRPASASAPPPSRG